MGNDVGRGRPKREIKFRAWDKVAKFMIDAPYYDLGNILSQKGTYEVMQSTGLKDRTGKEIYEGDVVAYSFLHGIHYDGDGNAIEEDWDGGKIIISWDAGKARFITPFTDTENIPVKLAPESFEIVGNIYENPELLNK